MAINTFLRVEELKFLRPQGQAVSLPDEVWRVAPLNAFVADKK